MTRDFRQDAISKRIEDAIEELDTLYYSIKNDGFKNLSTEQAEHIPVMLQAASSTLASARAHDAFLHFVPVLESRIFRTSLLLRSMRQRKSQNDFVLSLLHTSDMLWQARIPFFLSLLLILCGIVLGYTGVQQDSALFTTLAPQFIVDASAQYDDPVLGSFISMMPDLGWMGLLFHPSSRLMLIVIGIAATAWVGVSLGGILTPFLLLGVGGIVGGSSALLPPDSQMVEIARMVPTCIIVAYAMAFSQAAGVHLIQVFLPVADGKKRYHRARHLRHMFLLQYVALIHVIVGIGIYVLSMVVLPNSRWNFVIVILWSLLLVLWMLARQFVPKRIQERYRSTSFNEPYEHHVSPVVARSFPVYLREGVTVHARIALLTERLAAGLIDVVLIQVVAGVVVTAVLRLSTFSTQTTFLLAAATLIVVLVIYGIVFEWRFGGQTPGKRIFELRTMRLDGEPLSFSIITLRNLGNQQVFLVTPIFVIASYFAIEPVFAPFVAAAAIGILVTAVFPLFNRRRQQLGEFITGTVTIELPDTARPDRNDDSKP